MFDIFAPITARAAQAAAWLEEELPPIVDLDTGSVSVERMIMAIVGFAVFFQLLLMLSRYTGQKYHNWCVCVCLCVSSKSRKAQKKKKMLRL